MDDCIYCKIVEGKAPCFKIYEDGHFLAFLDIHPFCEGHTLVIPKKHYRWVWEVEAIGDYFALCQKIVRHYRKLFNIELVSSLIFGESVPHAHIQLLPDIDGHLRQRFGEKLAGMRLPQLEKEHGEALAQKLKLTI